MRNRPAQSQMLTDRRPPWLGGSRGRGDIRSSLLQALQQFFEMARDQFDEEELGIPEWKQADDALERTYEACAAKATISAVESLCAITRRYIDMAVEISTARAYYDGRI